MNMCLCSNTKGIFTAIKVESNGKKSITYKLLCSFCRDKFIKKDKVCFTDNEILEWIS